MKALHLKMGQGISDVIRDAWYVYRLENNMKPLAMQHKQSDKMHDPVTRGSLFINDVHYRTVIGPKANQSIC